MKERTKIVKEAQYRCGSINATHVFVFDDFITSGTTLCHIANAISETNPKVQVYGIALARTQRQHYWRQHGYPEGLRNDHIPAEWTARWPLESDR